MSYKRAEAHFKIVKDFLRKCFGFHIHQEEIHDQATKDNFAKLSPNDKYQLIKPQLDFFTSAVSRKSEILPTLATLASALIVLATLNKDLVTLSFMDVRVILSIFLILIPVTLHYYIKLMEKVATRASSIIASYQGKDPFRNIKISLVDQLSSDFPIIIVYIFYGVIFYILFKMWLS
ncbi:MAG: hypothetical protein WCK03_03075 [Candidatus Taylorbacteria bacterium]